MAELLGRAVLAEVQEADRVLDMGTGCGVNAVLAASTAREVTAVDVNPVAVSCARANAERNGVSDRVTVGLSDVFSNVEGPFDLIIFDPPFRWFKPRDWRERGTTDENYAPLTAFFDQVRDFLTPRGRVLLTFGTTGDLDYLEQQISGAHLKSEVIAHRDLVRSGQTVGYFTYKLTGPS
jgi:release factor glutamine methyltransferase